MTLLPPKAAKDPFDITTHGHTRTDDYYWMNDRENPAVISYLEAENAYKEAMMAHTVPLQEKLFAEIKGRIKEDDTSVPYRLGGYFYYYRFETGKEYPLHGRRRIEGSDVAQETQQDLLEKAGGEEIMLDVNALAEGQNYCSVGGLKTSPDHQKLGFASDFVGRRIYTIRFKDLTTGEMLPDILENADPGFAWANDGKTIFYVKQDETLRPYAVFRHILGTDAAQDVCVFTENDDTFFVGVSKSKSREFIFISCHAKVSSETRYLDANNPLGEFTVIEQRERDMEYSPEYFNGHFYLLTNWQATNFRLVRCPLGQTTREHWEEVVAHRTDVLLENVEIFRDYLVLQERREALTHLGIRNWKTGETHDIDFGEPVYMANIDYNPEFDTHWLRYNYTSLTTPSSVIDYHLGTKHKLLLKQQEVLGGFEASDYQAERAWATARDGVKVPISLVYKKGFEKGKEQPMWLTAYGSYGITYDPNFSAARISLLDRGFVVAIAHIRGGQEMGRHWYENGKFLEKRNTFNDFIDCADFLVKEGYATPSKLAIQGGSAGGMLMGAVVNMRPDLFKAVIADVPFVDVVTTMLDESIPLTTAEFDEWGNPKEEVYYHYMLSYSPYDHVVAQDYPAMLVTSGLHDSQVQYWEPTKWVAKLRDTKTNNAPLLLHTNMEAGHGGASGRFRRFKEVALVYAFAIDQLGLPVE